MIRRIGNGSPFAVFVGAAATVAGCGGGTGAAAQWATTPAPSNDNSFFDSAVVDSSGDIYVAGNMWGTDVLDLGSGISCWGSDGGADDALIAKYDANGVPLWAETLSGASTYSSFGGLAVDSSDNVFVAGCVEAEGDAVSLGNGVTIPGSNSQFNAFLAKYDPSGVPQWARTVVSGPDSSCFNALAIDSTGNLYAAGSIGDGGVYDFGGGVTATSTAVPYGMELPSNVVLVKYSPSGVPQWGQTVAAGTGPSEFGAVVVDSAGDVYVSGGISGAQTYDFGNRVTIASAYIGGDVADEEGSQGVLVKYNASGVAQWAQTIPAGALAIDAAGDLYVAGSIAGGYLSQTFDFGNGVTATPSEGPMAFSGLVGPQYLVLVKYDASGSALWARTVTNAGPNSHFASVAVDSSGNVFAAGTLFGIGDYSFGDGVDVEAGSNSELAVLLHYSSSGAARWARATSGDGAAIGASVAVGPGDDLYLAGGIVGALSFGSGVRATGVGAPYFWNGLLAKYR